MNCPTCRSENPTGSAFCSKCGTQIASFEKALVTQTETLVAPIIELARGSIFAGRYEIIEELGKGGMGRILRAFDRKIDVEVALKLVKSEIAADKKTIERFRNELRLAREIAHRNVCRMYDLNEEHGVYYITMEYVPGEDLKSFIHRAAPLSTGKAVSVAKQVCAGLAEAHRLGVVHRDLKPGNIMIDKEGNAKIMDFGIARSLRAKGITGAGMMIGTPEYMSPEQVEGKDVDERSDVYSLGIILYEMLTGRVPFEGDTPFTVGVKHKSEMPKDPRDINAHIPEDLGRLILRCLEKDKERRYQNVGELLADLSSVEKGLPTTKKTLPEQKPFTSREITVKLSLKKIFIRVLILISLAIIGVIAWRFLLLKKAAPISPGKPSIAILLFTDLSPQKDQEYFCDGMTDEIISKLSRLEGWKVIPRTSVMRYKNSNKDIKLIGQELDVANILEGSIRKEKDKIRISVRLLKVTDLASLWGDTYDRELKSIFEVQSDIAEKIAEVLEAKISPKVKEQFARKPTENLEAYNYFLKGLDYYYRYSKLDNENAILLFKKALELDPAYALAYAGLGNAYSQKALRFGFPRNWLDSAIEASNKAISLDSNLSEAFKALGLSYETKGWYQKARNAYERAIELNPNYFDALGNLGMVYYTTGEPARALIVLKKAVRIPAPTNLALALNYCRVGNAYRYLNELKKAVEWGNKCLEIEPGITFATYQAYDLLVAVHLLKGEYQQARDQVQKVLSVDPNHLRGIQLAGMVEIWAGDYQKAKEYYQKALQASPLEIIDIIPTISLGYVLFKMGNKEEALKLFIEGEQRTEKAMQLGNERPSLRISMAVIRSLQGRKSEAYKWLEQAIDMGWRDYARSLKDPLLEALHKDSQFQEIMTKVKAMVDEMRKRVEKEL